MEVSGETIRKGFQLKSDTELLDLANSGPGMTSEARSVLLQELQTRLVKAKQAAETIPLSHGWYTVFAPVDKIMFPKLCPRCPRFADSNSLRFKSLGDGKFRLFRWKTTAVFSNIPHCSGCAAELQRTRTICSWAWGFFGLLFIAIALWLQMPRFVIYVGLFAICAPFAYLYDRTSAVKLGASHDNLVEYRFRSHDYAKAFAELNGVQTENSESLQGEIEEAISRITV